LISKFRNISSDSIEYFNIKKSHRMEIFFGILNWDATENSCRIPLIHNQIEIPSGSRTRLTGNISHEKNP
jgi:hypothetical protein